VKESSWDDRETQVQWVTINSDAKEPNAEIAKKTIEPVNEPKHEIVPGTTKCIQVLLNATVAFSKYSCSVKEINFKNTLMFQVVYYNYEFYIFHLNIKLDHDYYYYGVIDFAITISVIIYI